MHMMVRRYPSVRVILLAVNLTVLLLPLGSFAFFRIYENQLVHETEAELIAQGAFMSAVMKRAVIAAVPDHQTYGVALDLPAPQDAYYTPVSPQLDLAKAEILPRRPDAVPASRPPDAALLEVGRQLTEVFTETQKTTLAGMRLLDHTGIVIGGRDEVGLSLAHLPEVSAAMTGRYVSVIRERISDEPPPPLASISRGTGIRVFTVFPVIHERRLWGLAVLSRTPNSIMRDLYAGRGHIILAGVTVLSLTLLLGLLTSLTISQPIRALIGRARKISESGTEAPAPLSFPGTAEIAELSQSFADMARSLQQRSEYIRNFAAHVSHEFKTPLTAIQGAAELLGEHMQSMSEEERGRFLASIVENTERLKLLVSRLLELARADNVVQSDEHTDVRAALERVRRAFEEQTSGIVIRAPETALARISAENFEIIASNLIGNAFQHGAATVEVDVKESAEVVEILFSDDGEGVSERNRARIFEPFFTTRRETGGTGLGLKIVMSLLEAHHGRIRLAESVKGAAFAVTLPRG